SLGGCVPTTSWRRVGRARFPASGPSRTASSNPRTSTATGRSPSRTIVVIGPVAILRKNSIGNLRPALGGRKIAIMKPLLFLVALGAVAPAKADEAVQRSINIQPSRHELNVHLGYQAGFGGAFGSPSGLKLVADYAYKVQRFTWFNLQVGNTFGFGGHDGLC